MRNKIYVLFSCQNNPILMSSRNSCLQFVVTENCKKFKFFPLDSDPDPGRAKSMRNIGLPKGSNPCGLISFSVPDYIYPILRNITSHWLTVTNTLHFSFLFSIDQYPGEMENLSNYKNRLSAREIWFLRGPVDLPVLWAGSSRGGGQEASWPPTPE